MDWTKTSWTKTGWTKMNWTKTRSTSQGQGGNKAKIKLNASMKTRNMV